MNELNTYTPQTPVASTAGTAMATSRQAQEVQAAMVVAKNFPRDENQSFARIMNACRRKSLAERAIYEYPRGGENVTGPSIRLAEVLAQNWGNVDFGYIELEQKSGESTVMAYCWDLETNTRQSKVFSVPHIRHTKKGDYALTDPRDIYELVANQSARRVRSCILGVIPGDIVEEAMIECSKTLSGGKALIGDRVRKMISTFQSDFGVPKEALEKYIGCKAEAFTEQSIVRLSGVYTALRDGRADREQYFDLSTAAKDDPAPEAPASAPAASPDDEEKVDFDAL